MGTPGSVLDTPACQLSSEEREKQASGKGQLSGQGPGAGEHSLYGFSVSFRLRITITAQAEPLMGGLQGTSAFLSQDHSLF